MKKVTLICTAAVAPISLLSPLHAAQQGAVPPSSRIASTARLLNDVMIQLPNDPRLYVLLGSGFFRPFTDGTGMAFEAKWLAGHPKATIKPISRMITTNTKTKVQQEIVYIWIEDGPVSLNVDLVRAGIFQGETMLDMVDNQNGMDALLKSDPKLADSWTEIQKERAAAPQDRSDRLIGESDYGARVARIKEADRYARQQKLGIWSDAMKEERDAESIR